MLNPFYWYSAVWSAVLILYSLNYSDFCQPLSFGLLIFLLISIVLCYILGNIFKKVYVFSFDNMKQHTSIKLTVLVVILYFINFIYAGNIPLLESMFGTRTTYHDFQSIPFFGVVIMIFAEIYGAYLCMQFVYFRKPQLFFEAVAVVMLSILQQNRNVLLVYTLAILLTYLKTHKVRLRAYVIGVAIIVLFAYVAGGLGNIRHLSSWSDSSYIVSLSRVNENYPAWLPKEFMWSYLYIVTPLANLNYNIRNRMYGYSLINLFVTFLPRFVQKRLNLVSSFGRVALLQNNFTTSTMYSQAYKYGGWTGIFVAFAIFLLEMLLFTYLIYRKKDKNDNLTKVTIVFQIYFSVLSFFTNVFNYDGCIIPIGLLIMIMLFSKVKFVFGGSSVGIRKIRFKLHRLD